jgi:hypothetical protein
MQVTYQFGIEEEYFLADATTRGTPRQGCSTLPAGWTEAGVQHLRVKVNMLERKGILEQAHV